MMLTTEAQHVAYPVAVVKVNGVKCRALLDTGAGSSYASASLINRLGIPATRVENRRIEMMVHTAIRKIQVYNLKITNLEEDFEMCADVSKVDKDVLLSLDNPRYEAMVNKYRHLSDIRLNDMDEKSELPVNLALGTSEYSRIKTATKPRIGSPGEPVAEYTHLGWTIHLELSWKCQTYTLQNQLLRIMTACAAGMSLEFKILLLSIKIQSMETSRSS